MIRTCIALVLALTANVGVAGHYIITDLGTLGGNESFAYGINNNGQVVGTADINTGTDYAFIWQDGVITNIESWLPVPSNRSSAVEINDNRIIVGTQHYTSDRGFAAADGSFLFVTSGSGNQNARDINNLNQVLVRDSGDVEIVDLDTGQTSELGNMSGVAINDLGQIAGGGIFWEAGNFTQLGDLGSCCSFAYDLNNSGQVVGKSNYRPGAENPFLWDINNGIVDLGTLGGDIGIAWAINEPGDVVGFSENADNQLRATIWPNGGTPSALTDLVIDLDGWQDLLEARDINDHGQIVGVGVTDSGDKHAFLLTLADTDIDGVPDNVDNCLEVANPDQRDTNGDGFGNICDPDLNNDGIVNPIDLGALKAVFFTDDEDADFDGDGVVNVVDLGVMKSLFFLPPGPSALVP